MVFVGKMLCENSIRFLFDYATEEGTIYWVNKILQRVSLDKLDGVIFDWLPGARNRVYNSASKLLPEAYSTCLGPI